MKKADTLPAVFNVKWYRDHNSDLAHLTDSELWDHYLQYGRSEGRICSQIDSYESFLELLPNSTDVLEIGKLSRPLCTLAKNIDIMSRDELIVKYTHDPSVLVSEIASVDYVIRNTKDWGVSDIFTAVVSSHNIEHAPCLVSFLKNIEKVLVPGGCAYFIIPDYRYCFDRYKFPTTIIDVLDAYYTNRTQPSVGAILEYSLLSQGNDTEKFWREPYQLSEKYYYSLSTDKIASVLGQDLEQYHDSHCWKFTPDYFLYITEQLYALGLTALKPIRVYPTLSNQLQFFAILTKE